MTEFTRRNVVKSAAWAAPAVVVATATPAYATSGPSTFQPEGCKFPGKPRRKSYRLATNCEGGKVKMVTINGKVAVWDGRYWWLRDQPDSRTPLPVSIYFTGGSTWTGVVKFLPCKEDC